MEDISSVDCEYPCWPIKINHCYIDNTLIYLIIGPRYILSAHTPRPMVPTVKPDIFWFTIYNVLSQKIPNVIIKISNHMTNDAKYKTTFITLKHLPFKNKILHFSWRRRLKYSRFYSLIHTHIQNQPCLQFDRPLVVIIWAWWLKVFVFIKTIVFENSLKCSLKKVKLWWSSWIIRRKSSLFSIFFSYSIIII